VRVGKTLTAKWPGKMTGNKGEEMTALKYLCVVGILCGGLLITACGGSSTLPVAQLIATATAHATSIATETPLAAPTSTTEPGANSSPPEPDGPIAAATLGPTVTPEPTLGSTTQAAAGEFWFSAANNDLDVFIGSGLIQSDLTLSGDEYRLALQEDSKTEPHVVTLFLPFDVQPGEITLKPYVVGANSIGPSASFSTGLELYGATEGTLTLDEMSGDTITGSMVFKAVSTSAAEKSVGVTGEFSGIVLVKK
jgi:hypothetical protein